MKNLFQNIFLLLCLLLIVGIGEARGQREPPEQMYVPANTQGETYQILGNIKKDAPKTSNYNETPDFVFINQNENFWNKIA